MVVWWYGGMGWYGGMVVWWYGGMEGMVVWWYGGMDVCWHGGVLGGSLHSPPPAPAPFMPYIGLDTGCSPNVDTTQRRKWAMEV